MTMTRGDVYFGVDSVDGIRVEREDEATDIYRGRGCRAQLRKVGGGAVDRLTETRC